MVVWRLREASVGGLGADCVVGSGWDGMAGLRWDGVVVNEKVRRLCYIPGR